MTANAPYMAVNDLNAERDNVAWYWRLIALMASWMILGGYLIIPPLFHSDPKDILKPSESVVTIFVVALLVAGYAFTGLLCFACKSLVFQAESVFLPSMASSALGLLTVLYSFLAYSYFHWNRSAVAATVLSACMTAVYALLLLVTNRQIARLRTQLTGRTSTTWQHEQPWYTNYLANMFPSMRNPDQYSYAGPIDNSHTEYQGGSTTTYNYPVTEDEGMRRHLAMLLRQPDNRPSPDANQSTFQLVLPDNESDNENLSTPNVRRASRRDHVSLSQPLHHPLHQPLQQQVPQPPAQPGRSLWPTHGRNRSSAGVSAEGSRGRTDVRGAGGEIRAKSREERRQEIEMGRVSR
ncbi:uncharacterized protein K452DRAFT_325937 [Aplosporella prunicola CBS 121167]|uniref:Uncharacterized protein n=1 Tax=Aplosporella prunicola CBS 121167 TaxID=1176127 RepID=A0A6A6BIC6_9PEZI|nr:uncharacterized protein K452DRAFT_325937 [Aplosporella prunicola CBS 121167]KAF2143378.1 hypothetical protein K452DRAFT_325937 [Aplosporella prunicola CBS 121167]